MTINTINYENFKKLFKEHGLKATSQRHKIYHCLHDLNYHPTAEEIYKHVSPKMPSLTKDTVYRTLNSLSLCGLAQKLPLPGGATRYELNLKKHYHFLCNICEQIYDFHWDEFSKLNPPNIGNASKVHDITALISGVCQNCNNKN